MHTEERNHFELKRQAHAMTARGLSYTPVVHTTAPTERAGQGTFGPASFGPLVELTPQ